MGAWDEHYLPIIGMVSLELICGILILLNKMALDNGFSLWIFVFYRQICATIATSPIAYLSRKQSSNARMDFSLFLLIFINAFIGGTLCMILHLEGLNYTSSSVASASFNLVPGVTFLMATILGLEQMNVKRLSNIAKMIGIALCVGGAIAMTFLRGQELLNADALLAADKWLVGCLLLAANVCSDSVYRILQVPITKRYSNYFSLSTWTCFFSMLQTGLISLFIERDRKTWIPSSSLEISAFLFSGIFGSGVQNVIQFWCISRKGPLFTAMFSPLSTVLTTFFGCIFIHEEVYLGTLLGPIVVIIGLYVFLWGQAEEIKAKKELESASLTVQENSSCNINILEQPLLADNQL